ncbi:MAG: PAS domain-containing protein [Candidatus Zixiibacteriota bacterium]
MSIEDLKKELNAERQAIAVFKKRFEGFRVLYNTVFEIEGASDEKTYDILCKNLMKLTMAKAVAIASCDNLSRSLTLESYCALMDNGEFLKSSCEIAAGVHEHYIENIIEEYKNDEPLMNRLFTIICSALPSKYYRVSIVREGKLLAIGLIRLQEDQNLEMKDLIDTFLSLAGTILERLNSSRELQKNNNWLSTTLQSIGDAIITTDTDGYITFMNKMAEKLTGWSRQEAISWPIEVIFEIYRENGEQNVKNPVQEILESKEVGSVINLTSIVSKDGTVIPITESAAPIRNDNKEITGIVLVFHDNSVIRESEQRHKESTRFLSLIIENLPSILYVKDADEQRFLRINKAGEELFGFNRHEFLGKRNEDIFPDKIAKKFNETDQEAIEYGMMIDIEEEKIETWHKGYRLLHTRKIPIMNDDGIPEFLLCISEDITEKRRGALEVARAHSELRQLLDATTPLCVIDNESNLIKVNENFCRLFDLKSDDIIGRKCYEIWQDNKETCNSSCPLHKIENGAKKVVTERVKKSISGKEIPVIMSSYPYRDVDGNISGVVMSYIDASRLRKTENALIQSEISLKQVIENCHEAIGVVVDGKVVFANKATEEITGQKVEEILGTDFGHFVHPEDLESVLKHYKELYSGQKDNVLIRCRIISKDKSVRWIEATAIITDWNDKSAILSFLNNITGNLGKEERIKELEMELDSLRRKST